MNVSINYDPIKEFSLTQIDLLFIEISITLFFECTDVSYKIQ